MADVLHKNQWGYKKGLSTESFLIYLSESWKLNIDNGRFVGVIFVDFRKAFDSVYVNHDVLRCKPQACGFCWILLHWLTSYLENRQQLVEINKLWCKIKTPGRVVWCSAWFPSGPTSVFDLCKQERMSYESESLCLMIIFLNLFKVRARAA